ncbi:hypothetical protein ABIF23_008194 [Bradyrhizobium elkanii]
MIDRYTPVTRERKASQPKQKASRPGTREHHQRGKPELVEAVPVPGQLAPVQEHHEVRQDRVAVDAAAADLAHQVHAHRVAAQREERAVAEREDTAIAPDQIDREREDGVADIFAPQRDQIGRHLEHRALRQQQVRQRDQHADRGDDQDERGRRAVERTGEDVRRHRPTPLPLPLAGERRPPWAAVLGRRRSGASAMARISARRVGVSPCRESTVWRDPHPNPPPQAGEGVAARFGAAIGCSKQVMLPPPAP